MSPALTRLQIKALRACGHHRTGMRLGGHRKTMQGLADMGLAEAKAPYQSKELRWFLTKAGEAMLAEVGSGEPRD